MADVKSMHIGFPRNYIALSRGFTSSHRGIDMCWNSDYGGANAPVYAPADGEVVATVNTKGNTASQGTGDWGNLVKIKHADGVYTLSAHLLKGSVCVKVGQKVKRGQQVALMNNSGYSFGSHVHFELYIGGSGTSYRVDPLKYCYAYPTDVLGIQRYNDGTPYTIMRYDPIAYVGTPVARDVTKDQIEVITDTLRARTEPSLKAKVLGYVNTGIYNFSEMKEADGYKWYNCGEFWCANDADETWCKIMPTEYVGHPVARDEMVNQIEITAHTLRARRDPNLRAEILGYALPGFYNCDEKTEADGYKWFNAGGEFWVAQNKNGDWVNWLPKKDPHYDMTMKNLTVEQKDEMVRWCEEHKIEYVLDEV